MGGKGLAEQEILEIIRLHVEENRTIKSLAQEFGVSESSVSRWLIKYRNKALLSIRKLRG